MYSVLCSQCSQLYDKNGACLILCNNCLEALMCGSRNETMVVNLKVCDCGAAKAKTTHVDWCSTCK